jgi:hypothetical protein
MRQWHRRSSSDPVLFCHGSDLPDGQQQKVAVTHLLFSTPARWPGGYGAAVGGGTTGELARAAAMRNEMRPDWLPLLGVSDSRQQGPNSDCGKQQRRPRQLNCLSPHLGCLVNPLLTALDPGVQRRSVDFGLLQ